MTSQALTPSSHDGLALKSLLGRAVAYGKKAVIPYDLMQFGLYGAATVIATGLFTLILPDAAAIRHSDFYLVLGGFIASLDSFMGSVSIPAIIAGGALLVFDSGLLLVRTSQRWRYAVVAQAAVGGIAGAACALFLAIVLLNLAIWVAIGMLILLVIGMMLSALAGG